MKMFEVVEFKEQTFEDDLDFYNGVVRVFRKEFPAVVTDAGDIVIKSRIYYAVSHIKHSGIVEEDSRVYKTARGAINYAQRLALENNYKIVPASNNLMEA